MNRSKRGNETAAVVLRFPDAVMRVALSVLADTMASDLERSLAASVMLVAARQGVGMPIWAVEAVRATRIA